MFIESRLLLYTLIGLLFALRVRVVDRWLLFCLNRELAGFVRTYLLWLYAFILVSVVWISAINVTAVAPGLHCVITGRLQLILATGLPDAVVVLPLVVSELDQFGLGFLFSRYNATNFAASLGFGTGALLYKTFKRVDLPKLAESIEQMAKEVKQQRADANRQKPTSKNWSMSSVQE